jgi:hypothetical protein
MEIYLYKRILFCFAFRASFGQVWTRYSERTVKKGTIEKFGLKAIAAALIGSDLPSARLKLSFAVGSVLEVSGKVQKCAKREGVCRLVIEPGASVPGFVVFADCLADLEKVKARKVRKGSLVRVTGKLQSFGASAVCLGDCRLW